MDNWVARMLSWPANAFSLGEADASDFAATCRVARRMSMQRANQGAVIVVVELFAKFNYTTGEYEDRRYNFYTHRGTGDFNNMKNLKAAYMNGERVDKTDQASCARLVMHEERVEFVKPHSRETPRYHPVAWDKAEFSGSQLMPTFDTTAADVAGGTSSPHREIDVDEHDMDVEDKDHMAVM